MAFTKIFNDFGVSLEGEDVNDKSFFVAKNLNQMKLKDTFPPAEKRNKKVQENHPFEATPKNVKLKAEGYSNKRKAREERTEEEGKSTKIRKEEQ